MKITRKTNLLVKTERKFIVRSESTEETICCTECAGQQQLQQSQQQMLRAEMTAGFFGISRREVFRLIESGKIHFLETDAGEVYVCPFSIRQTLNRIE